MARIVITRPNGETEYAELTTNKAQAGNDRLTVNKDGTTYYAKLDNGVSTHMFVIKPDGRKLYVQKEVKFTWKYTFDGSWENASKMVIPRTGVYKIMYGGNEGEMDMRSIFLKGAKFNKHSYGWEIKDKRGNAYQDRTLVSDEDEDDRWGELQYFEYVGEA